jgi:predicted amidohydrolase YtcJ
MNSAALKKAGISKDMQSYMGKEIPKDSSGELTGETPDYPAGLFVVDNVVPLPTPGEEEQWIEAGQKQRNALGITSIRDLSNWPHGQRSGGFSAPADGDAWVRRSLAAHRFGRRAATSP